MAEEIKENASGAPDPSSVKKVQKVELDLDDAPFLDDEPELEPEPKKEELPSREAAAETPVTEGKLSFKDRLLANKKKLIIAVGGAVALVVIAVVVKIFLFGEPTPPPPPPPKEPEIVTVAPKTLPPAPTSKFSLRWEPFWVEVKDTEGAVRYLTLQFSIPTENQNVFIEMNMKGLILRDALFYYLRNQPIISLSDDSKVQAFKGDLLTVINEHLGSGKVNEILIEEYLVQ